MRFASLLPVSALLLVAAFASGCAVEEARGTKLKNASASADRGGDDDETETAEAAQTNTGDVAPVVTPAPGPAPAQTPVNDKPVVTKPAIACATATDSVTASYWIALQRKPDPGGLQNWVAKIDGGETRHAVLKQIIQSNEFTNAFAGLTNAEFVTSLYRSFFDRTPDKAGYDLWLGNLDNGGSRTGIALLFADSDEFKNPNSNRAAACYF